MGGVLERQASVRLVACSGRILIQFLTLDDILCLDSVVKKSRDPG